MQKILVGVDLSPESDHAIAHAVTLARREGSKVVLVMVDCVPEFPANLAASSREIALSYTKELDQRLADDRRRLGLLHERWSSGGVELSHVIVDGFADEQIPKVASEIGAELIVVGSRGRTGLKRWLLGSIAEHVVRRAEQSVLIARGEPAPNGYRRVVIGTDFSPLASAALTRALPLLAPDLHIDLVYCWEWPWTAEVAVPIVELPHQELRAEFETRLRTAGDKIRADLRALGRPDPEVKVHLSQSAAAHGLVTIATEQQADLVVVGSHGHRGFRRMVLGSVAEATVRHAPCSVLVGR